MIPGLDALPADALTEPLALQPVPAEQIVAGRPMTGYRRLGSVDERELGLWQMTPGACRDTEEDEIFVVVAGRARVDFADGRPSLELAPGVVASLAEGDETVWIVAETLRKVVLF